MAVKLATTRGLRWCRPTGNRAERPRRLGQESDTSARLLAHSDRTLGKRLRARLFSRDLEGGLN
jgi:hypothetical protein